MRSEAKISDTQLADAELAELEDLENHVRLFKKASFEDQRKEWLQTDPEKRKKMIPHLGKELNIKLRTVVSVGARAKQFEQRKQTTEYKTEKEEADKRANLNQKNNEIDILERVINNEPNNVKAKQEWNRKVRELLDIDDTFIISEDNLYNELQKELEAIKLKTSLFERNQLFDVIKDKYNKYLRYGGVKNIGGKRSIEQRIQTLNHARTNFGIIKSEMIIKKRKDKKAAGGGGEAKAAGGVQFGSNIHTLSSIREQEEPESNMSRQILKEGGT
jgi:hypothetical protein